VCVNKNKNRSVRMEATTSAGSPLATMARPVPLGERASDPDRRPAFHTIYALRDSALVAAPFAVLAVRRRRHADISFANVVRPPRGDRTAGGSSAISGKEQPSGGKTHA